MNESYPGPAALKLLMSDLRAGFARGAGRIAADLSILFDTLRG